MRSILVNVCLMVWLTTTVCQADWLERFTFIKPQVSRKGVAAESDSGLPVFRVTPESTGLQIVRVSLPFAPGSLSPELSVLVLADGAELVPDVRVLTEHPGRPAFVRRAILTFEHVFSSVEPVDFRLQKRTKSQPHSTYRLADGIFAGSIGDLTIAVDGKQISVSREGEPVWKADLIAPIATEDAKTATEIVEQTEHFLWLRVLVADARWPRIIEVKADSLGTVGVRAHLQQGNPSNEKTPIKLVSPDFGWTISGPVGATIQIESGKAAEHTFAEGQPASVVGEHLALRFPDAHFMRRGDVVLNEESTVTYLRCRAADKLPHQEATWRSAAFTVAPKDAPAWTAMLEHSQVVSVAAEYWKEIYADVSHADVAPWDFLKRSQEVHQSGMESANSVGDDYGNVASLPTSGVGSMNRLNHCPPIFHEYYRSGRMPIRKTAVQWCNNFYDLSIWWGERREGEFGGTRYNNRAAMGSDFSSDPAYTWRSNRAVHFCTKGYDSFFYAYEETGDPRMATALHWQLDYAGRMIHTDEGECRNIGDVLDFVRLYEFTGVEEYLAQGLRLFRELRTKLSPGDVFEQGGRQILPNVHYIDDDAMGTKFPFAKPYIMGYALAGLPRLAKYVEDEEKLPEVIRAVAKFLADSQDPTGGWRYPHPRSSHTIIGQGMEHSAQIMRAAEYLHGKGESIESLLDAIERTLQGRIGGLERADTLLNGLTGWERSTGFLKDGKTIYDLYEKPEDRDASRDYTEGNVSTGAVSVEGGVYFSEVLDFYLKHRPAERLLNSTPELESVLKRIDKPKSDTKQPEEQTVYAGYGVEQGLPIFNDKRKARMDFSWAWDPDSGESFEAWRKRARAKLLETLLVPPPRTAFNAKVIARQSRDGYEARKIVFHVSADNAVPAYLLVPEGEGPFPAVVALHDHGAHFSIGKEKVVRPFEVSDEVKKDAEEWTSKYYGDRYIGDELARQGYVVLAIDALFWGERGRKEGVEYKEQQRISANLLQLGMTWSGVVTWDDIRSAEFLASQPEVDPARIAAMGLSMGSHRTWMLAAASDRIAAGAAICWMCSSDVLTRPGNNQTTGQSAYSMLVPNLRNFLDYPDVASIACPKPMLFYNGTQDKLFPVEGVEASYGKMQAVWDSQEVGERLETKLWPVPHEFNAAMQDEVYVWLKSVLGGEE